MTEPQAPEGDATAQMADLLDEAVRVMDDVMEETVMPTAKLVRLYGARNNVRTVLDHLPKEEHGR